MSLPKIFDVCVEKFEVGLKKINNASLLKLGKIMTVPTLL